MWFPKIPGPFWDSAGQVFGFSWASPCNFCSFHLPLAHWCPFAHSLSPCHLDGTLREHAGKHVLNLLCLTRTDDTMWIKFQQTDQAKKNFLRKRKPLQGIPPVVRPLYSTIMEFYGWSDLRHYLLSSPHFTKIENETQTAWVLPKVTAEKCKESLHFPLVILCLSHCHSGLPRKAPQAVERFSSWWGFQSKCLFALWASLTPSVPSGEEPGQWTRHCFSARPGLFVAY